MTLVTLQDIEAARARISDALYYSPCPPSVPISEVAGCDIYCKLDYLQRTGSFKERGARNALMLLSDEQRARGVVAASAGNHALGLAYHGGLLGIPVTVVMPRYAPLIKVTNCRNLGANVILHGADYPEAFNHAMHLARDKGMHAIPPFDDLAIIAGQGTMGLEVLEQAPDLDAIIVPIGGGGLIAGIATVMRALRPDVRIIGVEPARAASFTAAMEAGRPVLAPLDPTLADGLAVSMVGTLTFQVAAPLIDEIVQVTEDEIALAILRLAEREKSVVEGAGAAPLAAILAGKLPSVAGKRVVLPLCGGNIDPATLSKVIERGLVADGRLSRFIVVMRDRPGELATFSAAVAAAGANVAEIIHERAFAGPDISAVQVECTVETRDKAHAHDLYRQLEEVGFTVYPAERPTHSSSFA